MDPLALTFRPATREDLPRLVELLADDPLGGQRERVSTPLLEGYCSAFTAIDGDTNNELVVAVLEGKGLIGVLQLTFIPYLTYRGGWRALIEGV